MNYRRIAKIFAIFARSSATFIISYATIGKTSSEIFKTYFVWSEGGKAADKS